MNHWLLKSEPDDYSYDDLVAEKKCVWDGVGNAQALGFMRDMKRGDLAFYYHTGKEKRIVGICEIARAAYPDPNLDDEKRIVVDVKPRKRLPQPVALADVKADKAFADFHLVRNSRLSVMPVPDRLWKKLLSMAGA